MEWFHCNQCFVKSGFKFAVSSCGHICCEACTKPKQCTICGNNCSYLAITDKMKPEEKVYFTDHSKLFQSCLENISQIVHFQQRQRERLISHLKKQSTELERRLKDINDQCYRQLKEIQRENTDLKRQLSELRNENTELKKPLSLRRVSPGHFQSNGNQKITLPVAVTSPVTPHLRHLGHMVRADVSQEWSRERSLSHASVTTPGSASSHSSRSSHHQQGHRTLASFSTPTRVQRQIPNAFDLQFVSGLSFHSPQN